MLMSTFKKSILKSILLLSVFVVESSNDFGVLKGVYPLLRGFRESRVPRSGAASASRALPFIV